MGTSGGLALGLCVIFAAWSWSQIGQYTLLGLQIVVGLGLLIFVHELGISWWPSFAV